MVTEINSTAASASQLARPDAKTAQPSATPAEVAKTANAASTNSESLQDIEATVSNINTLAQNSQRSIHFSVAEKTGETIIKVFNSNTDELIREIPSKELQKIAEAIEAQQGSEGLLFKAII